MTSTLIQTHIPSLPTTPTTSASSHFKNLFKGLQQTPLPTSRPLHILSPPGAQDSYVDLAESPSQPSGHSLDVTSSRKPSLNVPVSQPPVSSLQTPAQNPTHCTIMPGAFHHPLLHEHPRAGPLSATPLARKHVLSSWVECVALQVCFPRAALDKGRSHEQGGEAELQLCPRHGTARISFKTSTSN